MEDTTKVDVKARQKAALARAQQFIKDVDSTLPGEVLGVPREKCIGGMRNTLHYYYFDVEELERGRAMKLRDTLAARGFWQVDLSEGAYVPSCSTAEIWATTWEVREALFSAKKQRNDKAREALRPKGIFYSQQ